MNIRVTNKGWSGPLVLMALALLAVGCRQDMHDQAKYEPLEASSLFDNGTSARHVPSYTVSRGSLGDTETANTGVLADGSFATDLPMPLTEELLARGQERFNIYCSPCHDRVGTARGMIVQRGFAQPPTYHQDRLREMPVGYFFDVISNGFGQMSGYKAQVRPADRWAIAAWIRVLQRSQNVAVTTLSSAERQFVEDGKSLLPAPHSADHADPTTLNSPHQRANGDDH